MFSVVEFAEVVRELPHAHVAAVVVILHLYVVALGHPEHRRVFALHLLMSLQME